MNSNAITASPSTNATTGKTIAPDPIAAQYCALEVDHEKPPRTGARSR
ncbi:hypothetical protein ACFQAS_00840 [Halopenitus salinus]|uniref:Uncharacterized protein n=1 Tax=Halopenitus salinus TaxID=1198295 RepID=A0ABD5V1K0_9EURY